MARGKLIDIATSVTLPSDEYTLRALGWERKNPQDAPDWPMPPAAPPVAAAAAACSPWRSPKPMPATSGPLAACWMPSGSMPSAAQTASPSNPSKDWRTLLMNWYLHSDEDRLLCDACFANRSHGDPAIETLLCLHDDWHWEAHPEEEHRPRHPTHLRCLRSHPAGHPLPHESALLTIPPQVAGWPFMVMFLPGDRLRSARAAFITLPDRQAIALYGRRPHKEKTAWMITPTLPGPSSRP